MTVILSHGNCLIYQNLNTSIKRQVSFYQNIVQNLTTYISYTIISTTNIFISVDKNSYDKITRNLTVNSWCYIRIEFTQLYCIPKYILG